MRFNPLGGEPASLSNAPPSAARPHRVLIVDDDEDIRLYMELLLTDAGYQVRTAESGYQALSSVLELRPDLILMDILMPGLDGYETTRRLKDSAATASIPVVIITSLGERKERIRGLEAGAQDFLSKPVDPTELLVRVRNLLRMKEYSDILREQNRTLESKVRQQTQQVRRQCIETVITLNRAAEYRDENTGQHVTRISHYCVALAEELSLDSAFRDQIYYASPMHDIGKLAIPDHILLKPGRFNAEEWRIMQNHTQLGHDILLGNQSPYLEMGADIALHHHEHWDGGGYPHGLSGEDIPVSARLMAICDVYDAMRSRRPYKDPIEHLRVVETIREGDDRTRPEQFDPDILSAFLRCHERFEEIFSNAARI